MDGITDQRGDKQAQKRITPILVDKGPKKVTTKDKGKIILGENEVTVVETRKMTSLHIT